MTQTQERAVFMLGDHYGVGRVWDKSTQVVNGEVRINRAVADALIKERLLLRGPTDPGAKIMLSRAGWMAASNIRKKLAAR